MQVVVLGDQTTHGGKVISATSKIFANNKPVALVGDQVSCPILGHGVNVIIQGSKVLFCSGKPVAVHNSMCACGCKLIASQVGFKVSK